MQSSKSGPRSQSRRVAPCQRRKIHDQQRFLSMASAGCRFILPLMVAAAIITKSQAQFRCPETKGFFPDPEQCDLYYACVDGQPEERLCKDGLVFRDDNPKKDFCDIPANVPCGDRTLLQEPQVSKQCPRANGYFKLDDPTSCDHFVNCIDGVAQLMPCPPGLVYEDKMATCVWPADATRLCEDVKRDALDDGFTCPEGDVAGPQGRILPHPTYPHPEDCAKFYICRNGVRPQKGQCEYGTVYNEDSFRCTDPDNVPGCEDYYKKKN
ncbi:protein obstructor-E [Cephus cinctus]|uniref:Protein obstructor-E n=1 Tax=Cephus cinctus TaxID=211228 RepID=A0AAJ7C187_CEPCN|nr:protein obstructor-E [Cephus cinctus]